MKIFFKIFIAISFVASSLLVQVQAVEEVAIIKSTSQSVISINDIIRVNIQIMNNRNTIISGVIYDVAPRFTEIVNDDPSERIETIETLDEIITNQDSINFNSKRFKVSLLPGQIQNLSYEVKFLEPPVYFINSGTYFGKTLFVDSGNKRFFSNDVEIFVKGDVNMIQDCNYNFVCEDGENYNTCPQDCVAPKTLLRSSFVQQELSRLVAAPPAFSLVITDPQGGETLKMGDTYNIKYRIDGEITENSELKIQFDLYTENEDYSRTLFKENIVDGLVKFQAGSLEWEVPKALIGSYVLIGNLVDFGNEVLSTYKMNDSFEILGLSPEEASVTLTPTSMTTFIVPSVPPTMSPSPTPPPTLLTPPTPTIHTPSVRKVSKKTIISKIDSDQNKLVAGQTIKIYGVRFTDKNKVILGNVIVAENLMSVTDTKKKTYLEFVVPEENPNNPYKCTKASPKKKYIKCVVRVSNVNGVSNSKTLNFLNPAYVENQKNKNRSSNNEHDNKSVLSKSVLGMKWMVEDLFALVVDQFR